MTSDAIYVIVAAVIFLITVIGWSYYIRDKNPSFEETIYTVVICAAYSIIWPVTLTLTFIGAIVFWIHEFMHNLNKDK